MNRSLTPLEKLAVEVAITTPERKNKYTPSAYVRWTIIDEIRAEMDRCGFDWKALRDKANEIARERRKAGTA